MMWTLIREGEKERENMSFKSPFTYTHTWFAVQNKKLHFVTSSPSLTILFLIRRFLHSGKEREKKKVD